MSKRSSKWIVILLVVIGLGSWYAIERNAGSEIQDQPLIATIERGNIENTISSAGSLKPSRFIDVGAQVSGQLEKLYAEVGDKVQADQLLAEIDARTQESRVDASRSALQALETQIASRQASLDLAQANALRQERLMAANATSQQDFDTATANLANAQASFTQLQKQIDQSRSSLSQEETQLEYTRINAPMTGTVVSIEMNEGRTLNANQQAPTILRIADLSTMTVETNISEADIGNIKVGMDIYFTTLSGGNRRWFGKLRQILPTPVIENNVVLYTGLFDVDNSDGSLLPEMTAQVFFITASARDVLTVPVGALTFARPAMPAPAGTTPPAPATPATPRPTTVAGPGSTVAPATSLANAAMARPADSAAPTTAMPGGRRQPSAQQTPAAQRTATVEVMMADGTRQQREVVIGVMSRVSAEVISGLQAGDQVVAGIIQSRTTQQTTQQFGPPGFGGFR
ncbi:MAG: efflux RND transporter periplasmic adaptor subunit [Pseudohongiella sp.]|nr:efflux RND transporter periplasmic adaptor subunit [Pseudohongiella sp.]